MRERDMERKGGGGARGEVQPKSIAFYRLEREEGLDLGFGFGCGREIRKEDP